MSEASSSKSIRFAPPDVVVAVGSGASTREFECYKVNLSFVSEYFDAMLSADMSETHTGRIEFPDKDPDAWVEFYKLVDPAQVAMARKHPVTTDNVRLLLPWFHEFQMKDYLRESDEVICAYLNALPDDDNKEGISFWDTRSGQARSRMASRKRLFADIIGLFLCSMTYNLRQSADIAEGKIHTVLKNLNRTIDLFSPDVVKLLVPIMIAPEERQWMEGPPVGFVVRRFFNELVGPHVKGDVDAEWRVPDEFVESHMGLCISPDLAGKPLFPLLVHSFLLREASNQQSSQEIDSAKRIITKLVQELPDELYYQLPHPNTKFMNASYMHYEARKGVMRRMWECANHELKSEYAQLGVSVPDFYKVDPNRPISFCGQVKDAIVLFLKKTSNNRNGPAMVEEIYFEVMQQYSQHDQGSIDFALGDLLNKGIILRNIDGSYGMAPGWHQLT